MNTAYAAMRVQNNEKSLASMVDLRSDTVTRPGAGMYEAMMTAPVGDDVYGDDETVNRLEQKTAGLLGKQAGLFVSSGTQSNLIAMLSHCQRGEEVITGEKYHVSMSEARGASVLGGAPFNVAWHLQGFGLAPLMISGVGDDEHGKIVLETMRDWGMKTHGIQVDPGHPTGKVTVSLDGGQPSYEIESDQAYDHISTEAVLSQIKGGDFSLLYHGSLLTRTSQSRAMLDSVMDAAMLAV